MKKIETLKELQNRQDEYFEGSGDNWKDDLITHYKVMVRMLENDRWHPDYRGVLDDWYYKEYLKVKE